MIKHWKSIVRFNKCRFTRFRYAEKLALDMLQINQTTFSELKYFSEISLVFTVISNGDRLVFDQACGQTFFYGQ